MGAGPGIAAGAVVRQSSLLALFPLTVLLFAVPFTPSSSSSSGSGTARRKRWTASWKSRKALTTLRAFSFSSLSFRIYSTFAHLHTLRSHQVINNACASIALLNATLNIHDPNVQLGEELSNLQAFSDGSCGFLLSSYSPF